MEAYNMLDICKQIRDPTDGSPEGHNQPATVGQAVFMTGKICKQYLPGSLV